MGGRLYKLAHGELSSWESIRFLVYLLYKWIKEIILWPFRMLKAVWLWFRPAVRLYGGLFAFAFGFSSAILMIYANLVPPLSGRGAHFQVDWWQPFDMLVAKGYIEAKAWKLGPENLRNLLWGISAYGAFLLALVGIYFSQARKIAADKTHALESKREQNERFAKAIEMLGTEGDVSRPTRIGAIYVLGALAIESSDYYGTVIDTLAAFIRDRASMNVHGDWPIWLAVDPPRPKQAIFLNDLDEFQIRQVREMGFKSPKADIVGALTQLSEINRKRNISNNSDRLVMLKFVDLRMARLDNLDLSGVDLTGVTFDFSLLKNIDFSSSNLSMAQMVSGWTISCNFNSATFDETVAFDQKFRDCKFEDAKFNTSLFFKAEFHHCDFKGANCSGMDVTGVRFLNPINLTKEQVSGMLNWKEAHFPDDFALPDKLDPSKDDD